MVTAYKHDLVSVRTARFQQATELAARRDVNADPTIPDGDDVVDILQRLNVDEDTLIAAYLSDRRLLDSLGIDEIREVFGDEVAVLVKNVRTLNSLPDVLDEHERDEVQSERLRRMLLAIVNDVRAVLIKLAFRVAHLHLLTRHDAAEREQLARETLEIFAPLANRLGVAQLKWELEDLSFRFLEPLTYKKIAKALEERRVDREEYVARFRTALEGILREAGINHAELSGRPKHIYSIWKKMQRKGVGVTELYDIRALRVLVDSVAECYAVLGLVHTHWRTIPKEFDDYIANPKPNGYQSLHTVVIGEKGKPVEVQIRTREMNEFAEHGFAAHWMYKEGSAQNDAMRAVVNSMRSLLEESGSNDQALIEDFRTEAFPDQVFVMTPKGDVIELSKGATPLDFAYAIHTEVGHRCRGAKINGRIVPLTQPLVTGDQVEIMTAPVAQPSRHWMDANSGYLFSSRARAKVRNWFHRQNSEGNMEAGRKLLEQKARHQGVPVPDLSKLAQHFGMKDESSLLINIGRGDIRPTQLDAYLQPELPPELPISEAADASFEQRTDAQVAGMHNLLTRVAQCCKPVPGDDVVGFITQGHGIAVHRRDCSNILNLSEEKRSRLVEIDWSGQAHMHPVELKVEGFDRPGLLSDITRLITDSKANLTRVDTRTDPQSLQVMMKLSLQIRSVDHLTRLINRLSQVRNVLEVERVSH
ncbi:MAG: RelA/SpoT family protein [Thiotrichales bacterium]